jgi:GTP-binding protein HflX
VDASHPGLEEQMSAVETLLAELELADRATIVALNKVDRVESDAALRGLVERFDAVPISARTGWGIGRLLERLDRAFRPRVARATLRIPYSDGPTLALCYERGRVLNRRNEADGITVEVELPPRLLGPLEVYRSPA